MKTLNRVHLNGLRALEAVGRLGALGPAADELGVTPGAVSQQVIRAERQLGRPVFRREGRRLVATEFGAALLPYLGEAFATLSRGLGQVLDRSPDVLTISVAPVLASKWLVPRLGAFAGENPHIRIRLDATTALVDLDGSDVDLALRVGAGDWPGVAAEHLIDQAVFPVCAPAIAARLRTHADMLAVPAIIDIYSVLSWDIWLRAVGLPEGAMQTGNSFTDASLCLDAAIAGQGVMLAWQTLAEYALAKGTLVAPFPERVPTGLAYWLVTSKNRREEPKVARFRRWVRAEFAGTARRMQEMVGGAG
ncbi:MAG: transcriptional regulator [Alphaproteobacteria bacterium]|nr:MAG: transcriptional regulator [Alphaproteobacteria bacterium]